MTGYMQQVRPKSGTVLQFQYDPEQCELTGGVGGWTEVPRPRMVAGTEFSGTPLYKLTFDLWLDGFAAQSSVEPTIAQLTKWGQPPAPGKEPPVVMLNYGVYSKLRWVVQDVLPSSTLRRGDGHRVQSKVTVTLLEYQGLTSNRTAADSVRSGLIATNIATGTTHRNPTVSTYTVVKGDTLPKIAARKLGNANRWTEIAKLNGVKDPMHLKTGTKLRLPAK